MNSSNRVAMNRFGVFVILLLIFFSSAYALEFEESFVQDHAGIIEAPYRANIENQLINIFNSGKAEFAVVTVDSLEGQPIETAAYNLVNGNLGDNEKNNGLLLLVSVQDRKYRFEVGRGLEPIFNDAKVGRLGRKYLVPAFSSGDYGKGIFDVITAVSSELDVSQTDVPPIKISDSASNLSRMNTLLGLLPFLIFILIIFLSYKNRNKRNDKYFFAAMLASNMFGRGGGGFGGMGGGSGGFGGFGGGSFGGGGASGGW